MGAGTVKKLFLILLFVPCLHAEGPLFQQKDTFTQQEFDNVYQDLRKKVSINNPGNFALVNATQTFTAPQKIVSGGSTVFNTTTNGEITQSLQPSFLVTNGAGATDITGDGTVYTQLWPTEIYDQGNDFASNTFTAPVDGRYYLSATTDIRNILVGHNIREISIVTSNREYRWIFDESLAQNDQSLHVCALADMDASDTATVTIRVIGGTKTVDILGSGAHNNFSGSLIN